MGVIKNIKKENLYFFAAFVVLVIIGFQLYGHAEGYTYLSDEHTIDIVKSKFWALSWILVSAFIIYWKREKPYVPALTVFAVSAYFVVLYGIMFSGTEYGMHGHWGDNGNRLALICKMMDYNTFFTDWYLKDLPSFYPPLWFYIMALYAKLINIEAYQTIKYGYLFIFLLYPWLLYWSWKKIVKPSIAAAIVVGTIFFAFRYLDWIYYEHITAALFMPWWLYYFERVGQDKKPNKFDWKFYLYGAILGGLIFMTYYYWFFMAFIVLPITLIQQYSKEKNLSNIIFEVRHKVILMVGVALVSAVYWVPLLRSIYWNGMSSAQNVWFGLRHTNLTSHWSKVTIESLLIFFGIFFLFYLFRSHKTGRLLYLFLGGFLLILLDRYMNLDESSFQSRKILEFFHVFVLAPASIGVMVLLNKCKLNKAVSFGVFGIIFLLFVIESNSLTKNYESVKFQNGLKQRVPTNDLKVFENVETYDKVFLTTHYLESCYLPYYLFIPLNNMTAHTAGRIDQREMFLDQAIKIIEADMLAYVLAYNRYSPIDYVYMPREKDSNKFVLTLYEVKFNKKAEAKKKVFEVDFLLSPDNFIKKHERGMFELHPPTRSIEFDEVVKSRYADIFWHLQPL